VVLQTGFVGNRQGYASAMALVMLIIIALASALVLKLLQRREVNL
jgi:multiple sugar transport system permease protein